MSAPRETNHPAMDLLRLLQKVRIDGENCWEWQAAVNGDGYAAYGGTFAHRVIYQFFYGLIPAGYQIDHTCRNKRCVNPVHLDVVTHAENQRRGVDARLRNCCQRGHPWKPETTGHLMNGSRVVRYCLVCRDANLKRRRDRDRAAKASKQHVA
jgi:hypothetical protein